MTQKIEKILLIVYLFVAIVSLALSYLKILSWWSTIAAIALPIIAMICWKNFGKFLICSIEQKDKVDTEINFVSLGNNFFYVFTGIVSLITGSILTYNLQNPNVIHWATVSMLISVLVGHIIVHTDLDPFRFLIGIGLMIIIGLALYAIDPLSNGYIQPYKWIYKLCLSLNLITNANVHFVVSAGYGGLGIYEFIKGVLFHRGIIACEKTPNVTDITFLKGKSETQIPFAKVIIENTDVFETLLGFCLRITVIDKDGKPTTYRILFGALRRKRIEAMLHRSNF